MSGHAIEPVDSTLREMRAKMSEIVRVGLDRPRRQPFLYGDPFEESIAADFEGNRASRRRLTHWARRIRRPERLR